MKKAVIVGAGTVGQATAKTLTIPYEFHDPNKGLHADLENADCVFLCLPTPETFTIKMALGLEVRLLKEYIKRLKHHPFVCVRSTTTLQIADCSDNLCIWPDFLRQQSWEEDAVNPKALVVGLPEDVNISQRFMKTLQEVTIFDNFHFTDKKSAILMKLATNSFFSLKVHFANVLNQFCKNAGINYNSFKEALITDSRMGTDHWDVPGPDGFFGYGGKSLPKDMRALSSEMTVYGVNTNLFEVVREENSLNRVPVDTVVGRPNYTGKIVIANPINLIESSIDRSLDSRDTPAYFKNLDLIRSMCANLNLRGKPAYIVDYNQCIKDKIPFNFIIDALPYVRHEYFDNNLPSRYISISPSPNRHEGVDRWCEKLDRYFNLIIPDMLPLIREGLCRLFFISNENAAMNKHFYEAIGGVLEKHNMTHKDVWCAFKGDGINGVAYYKMKYPDCNIVNYNYFSEVYAGSNINYRKKDWDNAKKFLCLNHTLKPFRAEIVWRMCRAGMLDEVNLSLLQKDVNGFKGGEVPGSGSDFMSITLNKSNRQKALGQVEEENTNFENWFGHLSDEEKESLYNFIDTKLPIYYDSDSSDINGMPPITGTWVDCKQKHYDENMMYIVTETSMSTFDGIAPSQQDLSEKIFKPMLLKMPFILVGDPFVLCRLREAGYRTFHDFWDESYDEEPNAQKRMQMVFSVIEKLYKMPRKDFVSMMQECEYILEHNLKRLRDLSDNEGLYKELLPIKRTTNWIRGI